MKRLAKGLLRAFTVLIKFLAGTGLTIAVFSFTAYLLGTETRRFLVSFGVFATVGFASEAFFTCITQQLNRIRDAMANAPRSEDDTWIRVFSRVCLNAVDWSFAGKPYGWSILVYGLSAALSTRVGQWYPQYFLIFWPLRGFINMAVIYFWEGWWGWRIEKWTERFPTGGCPWKYRDSPRAIKRYINPYYFWSWYCFGFIVEFMHLHVVPALQKLVLP